VVRDSEIVGRVTSVVYSKQLNAIIGLAYVAPDQVEPGSKLSIKDSAGQLLTAETVTMPFYDPDNLRQEV
jgi:sarcosine oxidase subunit alpha